MHCSCQLELTVVVALAVGFKQNPCRRVYACTQCTIDQAVEERTAAGGGHDMPTNLQK